MKNETRERLFQLCQLAMVEQDPDKLLVLFREINALTEAKEARPKRKRSGRSPTSRNDRGR